MDGYIHAHVPPGALAQVEIFRDLSELDLQELAERLSTRYAPRGSILWREGEAGGMLCIIKTGQVKVIAESDGQARTVAVLGPGASLGETSLLTGEPHSRTVQVTIDSVLWTMSKEEFEQVLRTYPAVAVNLSRMLAARLRVSDGKQVRSRKEDVERIVGVLGDRQSAQKLAEMLATHSLSRVLLLEVVDTGDENSTVDPSEPFHDIEPLSERVDRLGVQVELSSGDFSEVVSHLLRRYDHLLVQLPGEGGPYLDEAIDLCDVVVALNGQEGEHPLEERVPPAKLWKSSREGYSRRPRDRAHMEREWDRISRRLLGKRVGVALSSGGAHGLAHIGLLWVLEQEKIPIDFISGTSMGSIVGGAYAAGRRGQALYRIGEEASRLLQVKSGWRYWDLTLMGSGAIKGNIVKRRIERWVKGMQFEELEIPAFIAAAQVVRGGSVLFDSGALAEAIRASISVPLFFEPVPHGEDYLMDGAAVDPVPCACLAEAGADIIIACNVIPQVAERQYRGIRQRVGPGRPPRMLDVYHSEREIMSAQVALLKMQPVDVLIRPKVGMYSWTESQHIDEFVQRGVEAGMAAIPAIRELLKPGTRKRSQVSGRDA